MRSLQHDGGGNSIGNLFLQGKSLPTAEKLNKLMKAIDPGFEPILKIA
jgi:hypothetical protein